MSVHLVDTPIEKHKIFGQTIWVKREDLCSPNQGPPFAKTRGLYKELLKLREHGVSVVGYTESSISMAGWGVAWMCAELGMHAVIYDPQYISEEHEHIQVLRLHRSKWKELGAEIRPIKAGMVRVNFNICRKDLLKRYPGAVMLPLGLPLKETILETQRQAEECFEFPTVVVCVGSGTVCAGLLRGMPDTHVVGVLSRSSNIPRKRKTILDKANLIELGRFSEHVDFDLIDAGWEYTEKSRVEAPFPCHPYYDLKAWEWLVENKERLLPPILFWNIGH